MYHPYTNHAHFSIAASSGVVSDRGVPYLCFLQVVFWPGWYLLLSKLDLSGLQL